MAADKHFNQVSYNYDKKRSKGVLGYLVSRQMKMIINKLNPEKKDFILDAGCGSGFYSKIISYFNSKIFGIDLSENMIKIYNSNGFNGVVGNIENLPFKKRFNKVLCAGALEFVIDPNKTINSFNNVLKDNGEFILLYPRFNLFGLLYKIYHLMHNVKINLFSLNGIKGLLFNNGFKVVFIGKPNLLSGIIVAVKYIDK